MKYSRYIQTLNKCSFCVGCPILQSRFKLIHNKLSLKASLFNIISIIVDSIFIKFCRRLSICSIHFMKRHFFPIFLMQAILVNICIFFFFSISSLKYTSFNKILLLASKSIHLFILAVSPICNQCAISNSFTQYFYFFCSHIFLQTRC